MDSYIALTLFGAFFILVFIGVPISFAIGIATVGSMLLMFPWDIAVITVSQRLANGLDNFALLAIPFFIFAGTLMNSGGIAIRLINLAQVMVGRVPGSLGHVNVLANMMFGSISGSAVAAAAVSLRCRPEPGCTMLPTTRPMASAAVDMTRKYPRARPPTRPTLAACRIEPTPSTIVQKMTGAIIILMRYTKPVPMGLSSLATSGAAKPTAMPATTATITAR